MRDRLLAWGSRLGFAWARRRIDDEARGEFDTHLELLTERYIRAGLAPTEARAAARRQFGNVTWHREEIYRINGLGWIEQTFQDLRYAYRHLRRSPGFTLVTGGILALGIGASTAMFAVVNAVLLRPLPFADAEQLMLVHLTLPERDAAAIGGRLDNAWSYPKFRALLDTQRVFEGAALFDGRDLNLAGDGREPERVRGEVIADQYTALLGVMPAIGRAFTDAEVQRAGEPPVAMIGYSLWTRRYDSDPLIVGKVVQIDDKPYAIVGVLPPGFSGLTGEAEVWTPVPAFEPAAMSQPFNHSYSLVARRRQGVSPDAVLAAVREYGRAIDAAFPEGSSEPGLAWGARAVSLYDSRADADVRVASFVVFGGVAVLLLIACVNVTSLLVSRTRARQHEVALRMAIGASRLVVTRQLLIECVLVAALGGIAGLVVAKALLASAGTLLPDSSVFFGSPIAADMPRITGAAGLTRIGASMVGLDTTTLLFTAGIVGLTAVLITVAPALSVLSVRAGAFRRAGRGTIPGVSLFAARSGLVIVQLALSLALAIGAGLMVKSATRLYSTNIGVDPAGLLLIRLDLPAERSTAERGRAFFGQLLDRVRALPGIQAASLTSCVPLSAGCSSTSVSLPGADASAGRPANRGADLHDSQSDRVVGLHRATPDLFTTFGIRLRQGRFFADGDRADRPRVVILNESAARMLSPDESPVGKVVALGLRGFGEGAEVIGVVSDVRYRTIEAGVSPEAYVPSAQAYMRRMWLVIRTDANVPAVVSGIATEVSAMDPGLPLSEVKTMEQRVADATWRTRVAAWLFSGFAIVALVLTAIGVFGTVSHMVTQRRPEFGIRLALGSTRRHVIGLILSRVMIVAVVGIAVGVAMALWLSRSLTALLYEVEPHDPATFVLISLTMIGLAFIAGYLPAHYASRVDPLVALSHDPL